ncbi:olfactory receptor 5AP2-like [Pelobates fuscus]|uniref:olfactory receptor 5AP2-like n=1 Tax=Pelobates fuscus TaxID=191477 RepID=UPI002FE4F1A7
MTKKVSNESQVTEFLILGLSDSLELKVPLFLLFLLIYLITMLSNFVIITLICLDSHLQKPMYFFLCNMSFLDIFYTTVTTPNLLYNIISGDQRISFKGCMTQLFFFNSFGSMEYMLLTAMAYDRYIAICHPFSYKLLMNARACQLLAVTAWFAGFLAAVPLSVQISSLTYCSSNKINHFFCDLTALLKLACDDTSSTELIMFSDGLVIVLNCFVLTFVSYAQIISSILRLGSRENRFKAFSTCGSHLTVVTLLYMMIVCLYLKPVSSYSLQEAKIVSVFYVNILPMLNPVIYSLRNKDVKEALEKCMHCK